MSEKKLILYLSDIRNPGRTLLAATLAWIAKKENYIFDNYFDSYHQGIHFPGGDSRNLEQGQMTGGMVSGERHIEAFHFLAHHFELSLICEEASLFFSSIRNLDHPFMPLSGSYGKNINDIFKYFNVFIPKEIVMVGMDLNDALKGIEAYAYPEIYYRHAIGVPSFISDDDLENICQKDTKIFCLFVDDVRVKELSDLGYDVEIIDQLKKSDNYLTLTKRIALRWENRIQGWILGDPVLVSTWIPKACEENLFGIYGIPQESVIQEFERLLSSKGKVVYGRQYSDRDFFELSKINQCLQVIDPCRPPFQSVKHIDYQWQDDKEHKSFFEPEYTDVELKKFAKEGRILTSLMFWSGMIREIANFYSLMDLFAMTQLKCGLVLTAQSFEYMMHSPLELLTIPIEKGGVYPLVEPVLGSCGIGVGIESFIDNARLEEDLKSSISKITKKVTKNGYVPRGWWSTMDVNLHKCNLWNRPKPLDFLRYSPYFQFRFHQNEKTVDQGEDNLPYEHFLHSSKSSLMDAAKRIIRRFNLNKHIVAYRPYEFYRAGQINKDLVKTVKSAGLEYMFTKSGFKDPPEAKYLDNEFVAMNYTAGKWDGWTPFETINHVSDLRETEKTLLKQEKPGWIVSTIDACLWTFSGEFWKRGHQLFDIAKFCSDGGKSGKLINVKPYTIARYARIIGNNA